MKTDTPIRSASAGGHRALTRFGSPALVILACVAGQLQAQEKPAARQITLHPAAETQPALKYRLLPQVRDLTPGNAVQLYYRANSPEWTRWLRDYPLMERIDKVPTTPLKELPKDLDFLRGSQQLKEVDRAARRAYCDWEFIERFRESGVYTLLPDLQGFRTYALLLAARSRYELADGRYEQAAHSYQTGLALGRHVGDGPIFIQYLVGVACARMALDQIESWIQQPGSPNLYWPLTDLPTPLVDMRKALEGEQLCADNMFGDLREMLGRAKWEPISQARLKELQKKMAEVGSLTEAARDANYWQSPAGLVALATQYKQSRQFLLEHGRAAAEIDALPMLQTVVMQQLILYDRTMDDITKWRNAPFKVAHAEMGKPLQAAMAGRKAALPGLPYELLPAVHRVHAAGARLERQVAALRILEALRIYAAAHNGELPDALEAVKEVPIPNDPITGKSFVYRRLGNTAHLFGPAIDNRPDTAIHYDISMSRK